jgi:hypothetical protein
MRGVIRRATESRASREHIFFGLFNILAGAGSLAIGLGGGLGLGYLFFKKGDVKTPVPSPDA